MSTLSPADLTDTIAPGLHLRPISTPTQRIWCYGASTTRAADGCIALATTPGDLRSFSSVRSVLLGLAQVIHPSQQAAVASYLQRLDQVAPWGADLPTHAFSRMLSDGVAFAILRRISRESVHTSPLIHQGAILLNSVLARAGVNQAVLPHTGEVDRASLKLFARAMLLLTEKDGFSWVWEFGEDRDGGGASDLRLLIQRDFIAHLKTTLSPTIIHGQALRPSPEMTFQAETLESVSAALVLQNYSGCLGLMQHAPLDNAERARLTALVAVNTGRYELALDLLNTAIPLSKPSMAAHLCYLSGLIQAKRHYDPQASETHHLRGMAILDAASGRVDDDDGDLQLERAWLHNGLALNAALASRRSANPAPHVHSAFDHLRSAFACLESGRQPARMYLQFNLFSNMSFLMEIQGAYDVAINTLDSIFLDQSSENPAEQGRWSATLGYRIAMLHWKAGRQDVAASLLRRALASLEPAEEPARERILRGLGQVLLSSGHHKEASAAFSEGLAIGRKLRFAEATKHHAAGAIAAFVQDGAKGRARDLLNECMQVDHITLPTEGRGIAGIIVPKASPKLPAYYPEIDLEDVPRMDINRLLSGQDPMQRAGKCAA
jgi:tetratricopeptide (TPR) repeat protein